MIENILDLEKIDDKIPDPDDSGSVKDLPLISEKDSGSIKLNTNKYKNKPLLDLPLLNPDPGESKKKRPGIKFNIMNDDESEDSDSIKEENASEKAGQGFIAGIIASVNGRHNGAGDNIEEDNISELFPRAGKKKRLEDAEENLPEIDTGPKNAEQEEILFETDENQNMLLPRAIDPAKGQAGNTRIPSGVDEFDDSDDDGTGPTYSYLSSSHADEGSERSLTNQKKRKLAKKAVLTKSAVKGMEALDPDKTWKEEGLEYARRLGNDSPDFIGKEMKRLKNWNFAAQRMEDTPKNVSGWRKFLTFISWAAGKTVGKILPLLSLGPIFKIMANRRAKKHFQDMQEKRQFNQIPGWNGAEYGPNADKGKDVVADFRRVPTVWSQLTAEKAEDEHGKPLDPKITIYISQPKTGSAKTMQGRTVGHAMLGIEYSRFSRITDRYERYNLQYGFYPGVDFGDKPSTIMMGLYKDVVVPGLLKDDAGTRYDVSRTYPAKQRQVNEIFKASEKYADKGYQIYNRNCTTFVKEMVVDHAHLAISDDIFKMTEVRKSSMGNLGLFGASSVTSNAMAGASNIFMDKRKEDAETYYGLGNKQATQEDFTRYKESLKNEGDYSHRTFSPAQTGENMRRASGEHEGQISSYKYDKPLLDADGDRILSAYRLKTAAIDMGKDLMELVSTICPPEMRSEMPSEAYNTMLLLPVMGGSMDPIDRKIDAYAKDKKISSGDVLPSDALSDDLIRSTRKEISENLRLVSRLLTKYFKNDERLHQPFMNFMSILQYCIQFLDNAYRGKNRKKNLGGELGNIRDEMKGNQYTVRIGNKKEDFTPTHYESYIQIYKTPAAAVDAYSRYKNFKDRIGRDEKLSDAELNDFEKLDKMEDLAIQFDNAHNYMLEKDSYSQQDIDYVFQLRMNEKKGGVISGMRDNFTSSSGIYMSLIMEKIFGGMAGRFKKNKAEGGIDEEEIRDITKMSNWLDNDLNQCLTGKEEEMEMVIRGIKKAFPQPNEKNLMNALFDVIQKTWINRVFTEKSSDDKLKIGGLGAETAFEMIAAVDQSAFKKNLKRIVRKVLQEQPQAQRHQ